MARVDTEDPRVVLKGSKVYLRKSRIPWPRAMVGGAVMVAAIFFLLPFTQIITSLGRDNTDLLSVEVAIEPPPPPPLDVEPPEPPPEEEPPPEMDKQVQQLTLSQMDVALNIGTGNALAGAFSFEGFQLDASDTENELAIYDIQDLDRPPQRTMTGVLAYPPNLRRARVSGVVVLDVLIDEQGDVEVEKVLEASAREFREPAIEFAENCKFEPPQKDGRAVKARYTWPIRFSL